MPGKDDCPCEDCICVPKCRHKDFIKLFSDCLLLRIYEPNYPIIAVREKDRMYKILNALIPTEWDYVKLCTDDLPYISINKLHTSEDRAVKPIRGVDNQ